MTVPLSDTQLTADREQQIRTLDLLALMDDRSASLVSGHLAALLAEVDRLRARTLTASEYNAAWHAVEGAAGEEGADPGTVLHAVLDRLGIAWQDAAYPAAVEETPVVADDSSAPEHKDTLPEWLYQRFARYRRHAPTWGQLTEKDQSYWEHEARAVRRAVARNGFKPRPADQATPAAS